MRCPYCGGLNQERAVFCVNCGRDLRPPVPNAQSQRSTQQTPGKSTQRAATPPAQSHQPRASSTPTSTPPNNRRQPAATPAPQPTIVAAPEPPGPFPPRTMAQFEDLLPTGCQAYTVVESHVENGNKKCFSIAYPRCANWQQAATLLKALRENQDEQYATIMIRGLFSSQQDVNGFTNGQLQFDRNVRLGAQINNRYMLETGNGYSSDSLRFVLNG